MSSPFELLVRAIERLGFRLKMKVERLEGGAILHSPDPIDSEFLPNGKFFHGIFHQSGDWQNWRLPPPYFLVTFQEQKLNLPLIAELTMWEKQPQGVGQSEWKLQRVEDVPTLTDYRALDDDDYLEFGAMDPYTQWFVAYGHGGAGKAPKGKLRITDLENSYFASQLFVKEKNDFPLLIDALEATLHQKSFYFVTPVGSQFPRERGFVPKAIFRIYHSGMN
jgi:hypothetical protein